MKIMLCTVSPNLIGHRPAVLTFISRPFVSIGKQMAATAAIRDITPYVDIARYADVFSKTCNRIFYKMIKTAQLKK